MLSAVDAHCTNCGFSIAGWRGGECPDCGRDVPILFGTLVLTAQATGREALFHLDTTLGSRTLTELAGEDAEYCAVEQFRLVRDRATKGWRIAQCAGARNETYVDGRPLSHADAALGNGTVISLGKERLRLLAVVRHDPTV